MWLLHSTHNLFCVLTLCSPGLRGLLHLKVEAWRKGEQARYLLLLRHRVSLWERCSPQGLHMYPLASTISHGHWSAERLRKQVFRWTYWYLNSINTSTRVMRKKRILGRQVTLSPLLALRGSSLLYRIPCDIFMSQLKTKREIKYERNR